MKYCSLQFAKPPKKDDLFIIIIYLDQVDSSWTSLPTCLVGVREEHHNCSRCRYHLTSLLPHHREDRRQASTAQGGAAARRHGLVEGRSTATLQVY